MKIAIAAGVCLLAASSLLKDRGAIMIYEGRDRVVSLVENADSANLALIVLYRQRGDSVPLARLTGRPCIGIALFSRNDWAYILSSGRKLEDVRPQETNMRMRLYPARGDQPPVMEDIQSKGAWEAAGLMWAEKATDERSRTFFEKWSVPGYVKRATGPCTVE